MSKGRVRNREYDVEKSGYGVGVTGYSLSRIVEGEAEGGIRRRTTIMEVRSWDGGGGRGQ